MPGPGQYTKELVQNYQPKKLVNQRDKAKQVHSMNLQKHKQQQAQSYI